MTLNLPLSPENEAKLRERAAAMGADLTRFVLEVLEQKLAEPNGSAPSAPGARVAAWNRFVTGMEDWTKRLPSDRRMDDTREGIYEGRGE